jgi:hypothetical protein
VAPHLASSIQREIVRLVDDAAHKALAGASANDELDRVAQLQKVHDALPPPKDRTWLWAVAVASLCLATATAAATLRLPIVRIELDVTSASASFRLADALSWQGSWHVDPTLILFQNAEKTDLPDFPTPSWSDRASFDVRAGDGSATMRKLNAAAGAAVAIDLAGSSVSINISGAPSSVELNVTGTVSVGGIDASGTEWRPAAFEARSLPADIGASGSGNSAIPTLLRVTPLNELILRDMPVQDLNFMRESSDVRLRDIWQSELQSATLTMTDTGEKMTLNDGAMLRLSHSSGTAISLRIVPDAIRLRFEGKVRGITLGRGDFVRDLRPTLLEYVFHQERVGFLWGAMTFLWGLLWSARKLLVKP